MADEQRKSYRIAVFDPLRAAYLTLGDRGLTVRVLDQSAGGFGILCAEDPQVSPGATAVLTLDEAAFEVRVASVRPHRPVVSVPAAETEQPKPLTAFRIGLERVRDLESSGRPLCRAGWFDWWPSRQPGQAVSGLPAVAIGVALLLAAVPMAAVMSNSGSSRPWFATPMPVETESKPPARTEAPQEASPRRSTAEAIAGTPGAAALLAQEVSAEMSLSQSQKQQIRWLCDHTLEAIRQIELRWAEADPLVRDAVRDEVFRESRRRALALLSREQLASWQTLESSAAEPEPDPSPRAPHPTPKGD